MAMLATRKHTASIHPAAKRKRLRYEHPFSTHCRCIGRTDGSATGSGKSGSSGATSVAGAGRGGEELHECVCDGQPCLREALAANNRRRTSNRRARKALSDIQRYERGGGKKVAQ